ncbi:MAG TPA: FAD binding domain-containing protein [Pyrinomonadaceae bacterium]|nr:FAD binding domain-containing protein [Pyrinomonadaceae bacterium]
MKFILNDQDIETDEPTGSTVLDFVRYHKDLKGTKIGCREGDCGACTILVGELIDDKVRYRSMTSCLMPLANADGKHIVTIEGINPTDGSLTPVQQAMVDESGTQCGFCTVGFVMSLTGYCLGPHASSRALTDDAISAIDGNICRCTGYKSIERAACRVSDQLTVNSEQCVPEYFTSISRRLRALTTAAVEAETRPVGSVPYVGGGTDAYVQRHDEMAESAAMPLLYNDELRGIRDTGRYIEIGASATVTDLLESPLMNELFPKLYDQLKLVSSTPIRNMATLAGNFVNASPIGDMTVWFLALDAEVDLCARPRVSKGVSRTLALKELYLGYKQLAKQPDEIITAIRFKKPTGDFRFNFEKVCKRTYLDIASVNTAISLEIESKPGAAWVPPVLRGELPDASNASEIDHVITSAHVSAGGVAPIPLYLRKTSEFLVGKTISEETITAANEIIQSEISPISDVRGTEEYKRLLLWQLFRAHFVELFTI